MRIVRAFLNLGFARLMVCMWGVFHENDGNHENNENDEDNSAATNKERSAGLTGIQGCIN